MGRFSGCRLRTRLWLVLIGIVLSGCGLGATDEERISRARALSEEGDSAAAVIELRNVLQNDPVNLEARLMLAETALSIGDTATAAKEYKRAIELGVDPATIGAAYMQSMIGIRDFRAATAFYEELDSSRDEPAILDLYGRALLGLGRVDDARAAFDRALAAGGDDSVRLSLAQLALAQGDADLARAELDRLTDGGRNLARYWQITGDLAMRDSMPDQAISAYEKAIEIDQPDPYGIRTFDARARLGEAQLISGDLEGARATAESLIARAPQHPLPNYLMARVELQSGNPEEALGYAQKVVATAPKNLQARLLAGAASLAMGNPAQAQSYLAPAVADYPQSAPARQLLAQAQLQMGQSEETIDLLSPALDTIDDDDRLAALLGAAQVRAGRPDEAIEMFRDRLAADPDNNGLRLNLANALLAAKRPAEAAEVLGGLTGTESERLPGDVMLLTAELRAGNDEAAAKQADRIAALGEDNPPLFGLLGSSYAAVGRYDEARMYLERLRSLQPDSVPAMRGLGRIEANEGNLDLAREYFEQALSKSPNDPAILMELATIAEKQGEKDQMESLIAQAADAPDSGNRPKLLMAQIKVRQGDMVQAAGYAQRVLESSAGDPEALNILGLVALSENNPAIAQSRFEEAMKSQQGSSTLYFNLARAQHMSGDMAQVRTNLERSVQLAPEALLPSAAFAEMSLRDGDVAAAAGAIANLKEFHPDQPATRQLESELFMAEGKTSEAAAGFRDVLDRTGSRRALLGLYDATKRLEGGGEAIAVLEDWLAEHPDDGGARLLLAQDRAASGQAVEAVNEYETILEENPKNGVALNNLAWIYTEQGDPRAVEFAERAMALMPESGSVADTLGWALYKNGENERAVEVLRGAVEKTPEEPTIRYHLAVVLAAGGNREEAIRLLHEVLNDPAGATVHPEAQSLIRELGGK